MHGTGPGAAWDGPPGRSPWTLILLGSRVSALSTQEGPHHADVTLLSFRPPGLFMPPHSTGSIWLFRTFFLMWSDTNDGGACVDVCT